MSSNMADVQQYIKDAKSFFTAFNSRELIAHLTKEQLQRVFDITLMNWRPVQIDMVLYHKYGKLPLQPLTSERNTAASLILEIHHLILERTSKRRENLSWDVYFETRRMAEQLSYTRPYQGYYLF